MKCTIMYGESRVSLYVHVKYYSELQIPELSLFTKELITNEYPVLSLGGNHLVEATRQLLQECGDDADERSIDCLRLP